MAQRLREVAHQAATAQIVFLGQEADVIAHLEETFERFTRVRLAPLHLPAICKPTAAGQERALPAGLRSLRPVDQPVLKQLAFDPCDGRSDARTIAGRLLSCGPS